MSEHQRTSIAAADAIWYVLDDDAPDQPSESGRSFAILGEEVFVPAAIAGDEDRAFLLAILDNVAFIKNTGRIFLPASWLRRQYRDLAEVIDNIVRSVRERAEREG
jgi:hypothetical protein